MLGRVAGRFGRVEPRWRARALVLGLLADLPRKNCWTLAEHAGDPSPDGLQHLLGRAVWDEDGVRDDVRDYVVEHLGDPGAVLVVEDERLLADTITEGLRNRALAVDVAYDGDAALERLAVNDYDELTVGEPPATPATTFNLVRYIQVRA